VVPSAERQARTRERRTRESEELGEEGIVTVEGSRL
jgi:hypothetical protein